MKWQPNDKINTKDQLSGYIYDFYECDQANECFKDLNDFLTRKRMPMAKLEKLAFVYINHALLDEPDKLDYIKSYLEGDDEEEEQGEGSEDQED
ncbi:hypothetical protein PC128_g4658 [Phytophthora cactorum]|nr:hypothetical protein PC128_g4658 [Phytophthora cactorum]